MSGLTGKCTGERIKHFRNRVGMSRPVLGGLVGRGAEWVKAVETGRLQVPRLPMLLRIARALDVRDLAELTGDGYAVPVQAFTGEAHAALSAVQEADDPYGIAGGAWALTGALRDTGRWEEAITVALGGARQLEPWLNRTSDDDWRGMWGALQFEVGYVPARRGRHGEAWGYWERANEMARRLGPRYRHVPTSFSTTVMNAHAVTLDVELRRPGDAMRTANGFDANEIPSLARRSRHLIEVARAHHQRHDGPSTYAMLYAAERTAPDTIRFNGYARDILLSLAAAPPTGLRDDVHALCDRVGVRP
ncbi:MAG: transcriptional regulator [Pseudonocardiales bacterium]|nr:transcriptional regulator [Pseudonocardiales bacterium]MBV9030835.1 transcriptional regulator [Pseudonocardiales bacterium]